MMDSNGWSGLGCGVRVPFDWLEVDDYEVVRMMGVVLVEGQLVGIYVNCLILQHWNYKFSQNNPSIIFKFIIYYSRHTHCHLLPYHSLMAEQSLRHHEVSLITQEIVCILALRKQYFVLLIGSFQRWFSVDRILKITKIIIWHCKVVNFGQTLYSTMRKTTTALIGGGPVGLLGCHLLSKFNIEFLCFEKHETLRSHPSAHWLSARSKQILQQINTLERKVDQNQQDFNNFKYYRYCKQIGGIQLGKTNHFTPSIEEKLKTSFKLFNNYPNHISQSKLLQLFYDNLEQKSSILFNNEIVSIEKNDEGYLITNQNNEALCQAKYIILCNGFNSHLRSQIDIKLHEPKQFYKLINVYFHSKKLGSLLKQFKIQAMLHFVYNSNIPCVLVNHSLEQGQFVLQIPNYEPFVDLLTVYSPLQLIQTAIKKEYFDEIKDQVRIKHVGRWKLQGAMAQQMNRDNIFLAGDTAHTYTPAGGFGMNCGFQDINHLIHTIHTIERNPKANHHKLIDMYNKERLLTNKAYLQKSLANYRITEEIGSELGFPSQLTEYFYKFCSFLPDVKWSFGMSYNQKMRLLAMKGLFRPKEISPKLQLFFDNFDHSVQRLSVHLPQIVQSVNDNDIQDVWVDESVPYSQVQALFGQMDKKSIRRMALRNNQKIIRRDGIVLK